VVRVLIFLFQAEEGIRDFHVTGVQTCALPIYAHRERDALLDAGADAVVVEVGAVRVGRLDTDAALPVHRGGLAEGADQRLADRSSEERRGGIEGWTSAPRAW